MIYSSQLTACIFSMSPRSRTVPQRRVFASFLFRSAGEGPSLPLRYSPYPKLTSASLSRRGWLLEERSNPAAAATAQSRRAKQLSISLKGAPPKQRPVIHISQSSSSFSFLSHSILPTITPHLYSRCSISCAIPSGLITLPSLLHPLTVPSSSRRRGAGGHNTHKHGERFVRPPTARREPQQRRQLSLTVAALFHSCTCLPCCIGICHSLVAAAT